LPTFTPQKNTDFVESFFFLSFFAAFHYEFKHPIRERKKMALACRVARLLVRPCAFHCNRVSCRAFGGAVTGNQMMPPFHRLPTPTKSVRKISNKTKNKQMSNTKLVKENV